MDGKRDLTTSQHEAVEHFEGPLLVLAGPGSGKTRVITRRIARLIDRGVDPREILAITFTNKAANEMAARVAGLLNGERVWVSTFHRFCSRLLRQRAEAVGLQSNFTIYDTTDQQQLLRRVMQSLQIDTTHYRPSQIGHAISRAKNDLQTSDIYARAFQERVGDHMQAVVARVYPEYQKALLEANAVDFDDLLLHVVALLSDNPELRADLDDRWRFVLVDEYQDTNLAQYKIVAALAQNFPNLCVTGDPDQSIYGWRGAKIDNILRFEADFPQARIVRLEDNFRSTPQILQAADQLIAHNVQRKHKELRTENAEGSPVELLVFADADDEAEGLARMMREAVEEGIWNWSDFALVYRVNSLSRVLERALSRNRIPYQVAAGVSFYERAEIKDLIAYLRLVHNPADNIAFLRVVNTPTRGIGKTTQTRLAEWAASQGLSLLAACGRAGEHPRIAKRPAGLLRKFAEMIDSFAEIAPGPVYPLLQTVVDTTGLTQGWRDSMNEQDMQRLENVDELLNAAAQYDKLHPHDGSLEEFLEEASLVNDVDALDDEAGHVTLMTLHAAKGLEFPVVYVVGVEHGLIPHDRSLRENDPRELEEERRLLFVGMTRAMKQLGLTMTISRDIHGRSLRTIRSDFLSEMTLHERQFAPEVFHDSDWDEESADVAGADDFDFGDSARQHEFDDDDADVGFPDPDEDEFPPEDDEPAPRKKPPRGKRVPPAGLVMTGADLLNGTRSAAEVPQGFGVGQAVRHPRYGRGTVVSVSGFGARRTVTVAFEQDDRTETFLQAKCPLQPLGTG